MLASHNQIEGKRKGVSQTQRGGTAVILREELVPLVKDLEVDPSGLCRWSWYLLEGSEGHRSRVISAYSPCVSAASKSKTYYQQQARYIKIKGLKTNPKEMFRKDLLRQLRRWRERGDRTILMCKRRHGGRSNVQATG